MWILKRFLKYHPGFPLRQTDMNRDRKIRINQLIVPFGPGSIYIDRNGISFLINGLDYWYCRKRENNTNQEKADVSEYRRYERRLASMLKIDEFRIPPDYRNNSTNYIVKNHSLFVPVSRFPTWYVNTKTNELRQLDPYEHSLPKDGRWVPVRFFCLCENGHLSEFPWKEWIGCECSNSSGLRLYDKGYSDLGSIRVNCINCPPESSGRKGRTLAQTSHIFENGTIKESILSKNGFKCPGTKPWLGKECRDSECNEPMIVGFINQSNIYFPRVVSSISIPDKLSADEKALEIAKRMGIFEEMKSYANYKIDRDIKLDIIKKRWNGEIENGIISIEVLERILDLIIENPGIELVNLQGKKEIKNITEIRWDEYQILRETYRDDNNSELRVTEQAVPPELRKLIKKLSMVEMLKETRVLIGFDRLVPRFPKFEDTPHIANWCFFRNKREKPWLPAIEVFGEGIFIEFDSENFHSWYSKNKNWLGNRYEDAFIKRLAQSCKNVSYEKIHDLEWATLFILVHSFAHLIIREIIFECGYSSASLRERVYVSLDQKNRMAGVLIYTSSGDSEGSLGGVVQMGNPERFSRLVRKAIIKATWCSSDPVCSEGLIHTNAEFANLAACHSCIMLPETSCETGNRGLDRQLIVGPIDDRIKSFFSDFL